MEERKIVLNVNGIEVIYNHVILVLKGVSLQVPESGIVALLGGNGAGKTTTLRAICNMVRCEGVIRFDGKDMTRLPTEEVVRQRIAHVPEGRGTFTTLINCGLPLTRLNSSGTNLVLPVLITSSSSAQ